MHLTKREWLIVVSLLALGLIPILAGIIRIEELATGTEVTAENARFVNAPTPVVLHILSATYYCVVGAFQFLPSLRRHPSRWHKVSGKLLIPCGLISAITGLWMTQFYVGSEFNSLALYWLRLIVGTTMFFALIRGFILIKGRDFKSHSAWMTRAYALGIGAGTQVFTGIPLLVFQLGSETTVFIHMALGWSINVLFAEWIIRNRRNVAWVNLQHQEFS